MTGQVTEVSSFFAGRSRGIPFGFHVLAEQLGTLGYLSALAAWPGFAEGGGMTETNHANFIGNKNE